MSRREEPRSYQKPRAVDASRFGSKPPIRLGAGGGEAGCCFKALAASARLCLVLRGPALALGEVMLEAWGAEGGKGGSSKLAGQM